MISNPSAVPWGKKAFHGYIQPCTRSLPPSEWLAYDSSRLLARLDSSAGKINILADIGTDDKFLKDGQLEPKTLQEAAKEAKREDEVAVRMQEGYDHSYFFVSTCRLGGRSGYSGRSGVNSGAVGVIGGGC
jgi:S-formylglutathione hydrolase